MTHRRLFIVLLMFLSTIAGTGCSIDHHLQPAVNANPNQPQNFDGVLVHFLDIKEGEVSLIQYPDGYNILIDTGGNIEDNLRANEQNDSGEEEAEDINTLPEILEAWHVDRIDLLVLTNGMEGHTGGLAELLKHVPVKKVMVPKLLKDEIVQPSLLNDIELLEVVEGDLVKLPLNTTMKILFPGEPLSLSPQANSLVFMFQHGNIHFLFTSDINDQVELRLKEKYNLKAEILKVSDGGSIHASHPEFLREVDAQVAVIFNGHHQSMGRQEVLERLNETWIDVYQTEIHGTVTIQSTGDDYQVIKEKN
ncbi:MAG: hypothetical protein H0Z33_02530 [Bacillaceae bacterium]|nr:hypothetical protein [Bacillaceae bacterium]